MLNFLFIFIIAIMAYPLLNDITDLIHTLFETIRSYCGVIISHNNYIINMNNSPPDEGFTVQGFQGEEEINDL